MITSYDIRMAYARLHNLTSIAEFEKYGLMDAKQYPSEWLELDINEFMVIAGFLTEEAFKPTEIVCYPDKETEKPKRGRKPKAK